MTNDAASSTNKDEKQYLELIGKILDTGATRTDRTQTGTISLFAPTPCRYSLLDNTLPLLTTKSVFFRGVAEELLWFLHGQTYAGHLQDKNIHIWDGNGSREFLDNLGFKDRVVGDLGPVYGFQWRFFGADYVDCFTDYNPDSESVRRFGVDQIKTVISQLQNDPFSRRIILSAWNPADLPKMALPPCHILCQFYVSEAVAPSNKLRLSCQMYQRSCDVGLGVPFNIASYSLLTHMIAHACDMEANEFVHVMGDAHIYSDHVDSLKQQLLREPRPFPKICFKPEFVRGGGFDALMKVEFKDFQVVGYDPHPKIAMKMAV